MLNAKFKMSLGWLICSSVFSFAFIPFIVYLKTFHSLDKHFPKNR